MSEMTKRSRPQSKLRQTLESNSVLLPPSPEATNQNLNQVREIRRHPAKTRHTTSRMRQMTIQSRELLPKILYRRLIREITVRRMQITIKKLEEIITIGVETKRTIEVVIVTMILRMMVMTIITKRKSGTIKIIFQTKIKINQPKMRLIKMKSTAMTMVTRKIKPMIEELKIGRTNHAVADTAKIRRTTRNTFRKIPTILRMALPNTKKRTKTMLTLRIE